MPSVVLVGGRSVSLRVLFGLAALAVLTGAAFMPFSIYVPADSSHWDSARMASCPVELTEQEHPSNLTILVLPVLVVGGLFSANPLIGLVGVFLSASLIWSAFVAPFRSLGPRSVVVTRALSLLQIGLAVAGWIGQLSNDPADPCVRETLRFSIGFYVAFVALVLVAVSAFSPRPPGAGVSGRPKGTL